MVVHEVRITGTKKVRREGREIYQGPSVPHEPVVGELWLDTRTRSYYVFVAGDRWVKVR